MPRDWIRVASRRARARATARPLLTRSRYAPFSLRLPRTDNETDDSTLARQSRSIISRMRIAMTPPTRQRRAPFEYTFIFVPCVKRFVRAIETIRRNDLALGWSACFVLRER